MCEQCRRPEKACICHCIKKVTSPFNIAFLQHPSESKETKGTAWLAHLCVDNSQFWVGEVFEEEHPLWAWLSQFEQVHVLYPHTEEFHGTLSQACKVSSNSAVVIIDGTWRKTRKMLYLNPRLAELSRVQIHPTQPSEYQIRKEPNVESLSTMEAVAQVVLEYGDAPTADYLKGSFRDFIQFQKQFWPS